MSLPTLLVVDDDRDHLDFTLSALAESGCSHHIVTASDGQEALDYLFGERLHHSRATDDQPELVLLDISMPGIDGLEVVSRMRNDPRTFFVPVVFLSFISEHSPGVRVLNGGLNSYLRKPLDSREFNDLLLKVRGYWKPFSFCT